MAHYLILSAFFNILRCSTDWATPRISDEFIRLLFLGEEVVFEPTTHGSLSIVIKFEYCCVRLNLLF